MGRFTALIVEQTPCQVWKSGKMGQNWKKVPVKGNLLTFKGGIFFLCGLIVGFCDLVDRDETARQHFSFSALTKHINIFEYEDTFNQDATPKWLVLVK
jgi:hypothetical protein